VYPILQGLDLYLAKGKAISFNSKDFNLVKASLYEYEYHFNDKRCENLDMVGTYRPYHYNRGDFGLFIYAEMFGMYLLSIVRQTRMSLREAHTLALDSVLTHGSFHYLLERYCILVDDVSKDEEGLYAAYKKNIYSQTWGTQDCIEETLANAFVFKSYPHWPESKKDYIISLYRRQREGYIQASDLEFHDYLELHEALERQIKGQSIHKTQCFDKTQSTPNLYEFMHMNNPFRFMGLPVYLVNDCKRQEDFIRIVQLLFPPRVSPILAVALLGPPCWALFFFFSSIIFFIISIFLSIIIPSAQFSN